MEMRYKSKDHTKEMEKMMEYAKCVSVRDEQLKQKKFIELNNKNLNQKLELMQELERLKDLKYY